MDDSITRFRGDTHALPVVCSTRTGAVDISGWGFTLSVSSSPEPTEASYVFQCTGSIDDATAGQAHFDFTEEQVNRVGEFYYDIQIIDAASKIRTIKKGTITFVQDITK